MKKLRICMISSEFPPHAAGIGYAAYNLAKSLTNRGHRVTVITRGNWQGRQRNYSGIRVYELPYVAFPPPLHLVFHGFFVNRLLQKLQTNFDIIHLHSPLIPSVHTSLPVITTVHSTWQTETQSFSRVVDWYSLAAKLFRRSFMTSENQVFAQSAGLIAISEAVAEELNRHYLILPDKVRVIRNSLDLKHYLHVEEIKNKSQSHRILAVGRLVYRKGFTDLVDAAKIVVDRYPQVIFTLIGEGPLKGLLRKKISAYNLENNFILKGMCPHDQVIKYMHLSGMIVIPSYYEGLPLTLLEALSAGKAVIGTDICGIKETLEHGKNGLVVPVKKPEFIAQAIIRLIQNPALRINLEKNAKYTARSFDVRHMTDQILEIYQHLILKKISGGVYAA